MHGWSGWCRIGPRGESHHPGGNRDAKSGSWRGTIIAVCKAGLRFLFFFSLSEYRPLIVPRTGTEKVLSPWLGCSNKGLWNGGGRLSWTGFSNL